MGIHILAFLSETYILKKDSRVQCGRNSKSCTQELWIYWEIMNNSEIKIYKTVLKEVSEKHDGAEDFINRTIEEICYQEKLFAEEVIYFLCFLVSFLAVK